MVPVSPLAPTVALDGAIATLHGGGGAGVGGGPGEGGTGDGSGVGGVGSAGGTASSEMVTETSPIVTCPVRANPVFGVTVTATDPDRVLAAFGGTVIQETSADADHEQPVSVSTASETAPPLADTVV